MIMVMVLMMLMLPAAWSARRPRLVSVSVGAMT